MKNILKNILITTILSIIFVITFSLIKQLWGSQFAIHSMIFSFYNPLLKMGNWFAPIELIPFIGTYIYKAFSFNTWLFFIIPMFLLTLTYKLLFKKEMSKIAIITATLTFTISGYIPLSYTYYHITKRLLPSNPIMIEPGQIIFIFIICLLSLVIFNIFLKKLILESNALKETRKVPLLILSSAIFVIFALFIPTFQTTNYFTCNPGFITTSEPSTEVKINPSHLASVNGGYVNQKGELVIKTSYAEKKEFSDGLAAIRIDEKWGYINTSGKIVIKPLFKTGKNFSEGLSAAEMENQKWGFINKSGDFIIKPIFDYADYFSEGLALIRLNNKYGYINKSGQIEISPRYFSAGSFNNGLAPVTNNENKWMFIDKSAQIAINLRLNKYAMPFKNGQATTYDNKNWVKIDTTGKEICGGINPYPQ